MNRSLHRRALFALLAGAFFVMQTGAALPASEAQGPSAGEWPAPDQSVTSPQRLPELVPAEERTPADTPQADRISEVKAGVVETKDGLRLRLVTDIGNVRIHVKESGQVSYSVRIETDSRQPDARALIQQFVVTARSTPTGVYITGQVPAREFRGRRWVEFDVNVPPNYELDINSRAGNIQVEDIEGRVSLVTGGGNISAGRVGGPSAAGARLETQGGHINVQDVNGELRAITAGGHITANSVQGEATMRTGGGHVRVGTIAGAARLDTGGGNISVQRAMAEVSAITGGGQVDIGEAAGPIRARTGGGVIRVLRVTGPTDLNTGGGSIFFTQVQGAVRASTGAGTITAFFLPESKSFGPSQLISGLGDVVVYLPRDLAITINAVIETPADHRIEADPALPLKVSYSSSGGGQQEVRGECTLNGGGDLLRIRTTAGNIRLKLSDPATQLQQNESMKKRFKQRLELQEMRRLQLQEQVRAQAGPQAEALAEARQQIAEQARQQAAEQAREASRLAGLQRRIEKMIIGGVRVDAEEQQKKLSYYVPPDYPDVAREAGIEGSVRLQVVVAEDGTVSDARVLAGEPILADAALAAVRQWRYQPTLIDGKPVKVVTKVTVVFRLD